ncbi:Magnesium transporter MgtE [Planctomycetales bacterium 10988]|nr:Magnesium transporter MgtE [Planctomycetales bacterium 10988]
MSRGTVSEEHLQESVLGYIRTDVVTVKAHHTLETALQEIRKSQFEGRIVYFYVMDEEEKLIGVLPLRRLLLHNPQKKVQDVMIPKVIRLPDTATILDACDLFMMHRLLALPVVDENEKILGVLDVEIYTQEMSDLAHYEESEDVFQLIGVRLAHVRRAGLPVVFASRFPWLLCNVAGGLACAALAQLFQDTLDQLVVLALFIPIVLALAESVSIQSLTLTLQAQHEGPFRWQNFFKQLLRELPMGLLLGAACGGLVAIVAVLWQGETLLAGLLLASILISITTATMYGLLVPTGIRAFQRDPKVASGPIVLALTDLSTLFYYLGLASWVAGG